MLNSKEMCEWLDTVFVKKKAPRQLPFRKVHGLRTCILKHSEAPLASTDQGIFCAHCGSPCLSLMYLGAGKSSWVPFYRTWNMIREFQDKMILNIEDLISEATQPSFEGDR